MLKAHKTGHAKDRLAVGELWENTNQVFCMTVGTALDAAGVTAQFRVPAFGEWRARRVDRPSGRPRRDEGAEVMGRIFPRRGRKQPLICGNTGGRYWD
ncbi:MAG: hypothetical protein ACRDR6_24470 [Pseudonocardiaceae bacterium]